MRIAVLVQDDDVPRRYVDVVDERGTVVNWKLVRTHGRPAQDGRRYEHANVSSRRRHGSPRRDKCTGLYPGHSMPKNACRGALFGRWGHLAGAVEDGFAR